MPHTDKARAKVPSLCVECSEVVAVLPSPFEHDNGDAVVDGVFHDDYQRS